MGIVGERRGVSGVSPTWGRMCVGKLHRDDHVELTLRRSPIEPRALERSLCAGKEAAARPSWGSSMCVARLILKSCEETLGGYDEGMRKAAEVVNSRMSTFEAFL